MSDIYTGVFFRREKTYLECQQEVETSAANGQPIDPTRMDRWTPMGETIMSSVPEQGRFIFFNGISYRIADVTWSIRLPEEPGQPNYNDPQVMITLRQESPPRGLLTPEEDFFK